MGATDERESRDRRLEDPIKMFDDPKESRSRCLMVSGPSDKSDSNENNPKRKKIKN